MPRTASADQSGIINSRGNYMTDTLAPTLTDPTAPADPTPTPRTRSGYGALWARTPRELGFLLPLLPITMFALSVLSSIFFTGVGTIVLVFGIFVVLAALYIARGFGMFELIRLRYS